MAKLDRSGKFVCPAWLVELADISLSRLGQALKTLADVGPIRQSIGVVSRKALYMSQADLGALVRLFLNSGGLLRSQESGRCGVALRRTARNSGPVHLAACFHKLERWRGAARPAAGLVRSLASGSLGEGLLR